MASWMVHLRIADALLDQITWLDKTAFVMGNIAPDSGVPNSDWSAFTPPKSITHYYTIAKSINIDRFCNDYFSQQRILSFSKEEYSFFLGYYIHLLTDIEWANKISKPAKKLHPEEYAENRAAFMERMKEDWYDLDFRFLQEHPDFRAFQIYEQAAGFRNEFMKEFSEEAFDNRREYICGFYRGEEHGQLYRKYPYLTPEQADRFVQETVDFVMHKISVYPKQNSEYRNRKKAVIYIHGKGGNSEEANQYTSLFPDAQVMGFDYKSETPWEAQEEFTAYFQQIHLEYQSVCVIANSIGAYFLMNTLPNSKIERAYFISPIVNMEKLITDMMVWASVTEDELRRKQEIQTTFGETLSWDYLCYVRAHPIHWNVPTHILYGEKDHLTDLTTISHFAEQTGSDLEMIPCGEHWFHTEPQLRYLEEWLRKSQRL